MVVLLRVKLLSELNHLVPLGVEILALHFERIIYLALKQISLPYVALKILNFLI